MQTVNSTGTTKNIFATGAGGKPYKSFSIANDAPIYNYKVQGHNLNTWGLKDQGGQEWYLTDGGQWRNVATKALSATAPTWTPAAPAAPAAPPPSTAPTPEAAPPTWRSVQDFVPKSSVDLFNAGPAPTMAPAKSYWDYFPKDPTSTASYQYNLKKKNEELTRNLSRMGLLGSGVELEKRADAQDQVAAAETDRLARGAEIDSSNDNARQIAQYPGGEHSPQ
jgi:hypothetical protein